MGKRTIATTEKEGTAKPEKLEKNVFVVEGVNATLDAILQSLIEHDKGLAAAVDEGHDAATVRRVWAMLDRSEYKRRQAPPGPKVTRRHLRQDRRYPITNRYREN